MVGLGHAMGGKWGRKESFAQVVYYIAVRAAFEATVIIGYITGYPAACKPSVALAVGPQAQPKLACQP